MPNIREPNEKNPLMPKRERKGRYLHSRRLIFCATLYMSWTPPLSVLLNQPPPKKTYRRNQEGWRTREIKMKPTLHLSTVSFSISKSHFLRQYLRIQSRPKKAKGSNHARGVAKIYRHASKGGPLKKKGRREVVFSRYPLGGTPSGVRPITP